MILKLLSPPGNDIAMKTQNLLYKFSLLPQENKKDVNNSGNYKTEGNKKKRPYDKGDWSSNNWKQGNGWQKGDWKRGDWKSGGQGKKKAKYSNEEWNTFFKEEAAKKKDNPPSE